MNAQTQLENIINASADQCTHLHAAFTALARLAVIEGFVPEIAVVPSTDGMGAGRAVVSVRMARPLYTEIARLEELAKAEAQDGTADDN